LHRERPRRGRRRAGRYICRRQGGRDERLRTLTARLATVDAARVAGDHDGGRGRGPVSSTSVSDRIAIKGIRAHGRHGVLEHERRVGQPFVVDLELGLDTGPAALADDLSRTVDYGSLTLEVHDVIASEPVDLIETLAQRIADPVLGHEPVTG